VHPEREMHPLTFAEFYFPFGFGQLTARHFGHRHERSAKATPWCESVRAHVRYLFAALGYIVSIIDLCCQIQYYGEWEWERDHRAVGLLLSC